LLQTLKSQDYVGVGSPNLAAVLISEHELFFTLHMSATVCLVILKLFQMLRKWHSNLHFLGSL